MRRFCRRKPRCPRPRRARKKRTRPPRRRLPVTSGAGEATVKSRAQHRRYYSQSLRALLALPRRRWRISPRRSSLRFRRRRRHMRRCRLTLVIPRRERPAHHDQERHRRRSRRGGLCRLHLPHAVRPDRGIHRRGACQNRAAARRRLSPGRDRAQSEGRPRYRARDAGGTYRSE